MRPSISIAILVSALACAANLGAQSQEEMLKRWEAKQNESWFQDGAWQPDFAAAKARAKEEGKLILAYFSRSYSP